MLKLTIKGRIPSKKNQRRRIMRGGRVFDVPSKNFEAWHEEQMWSLKTQNPARIENIEKIEITFFAPDKRKADMTNKAESIMDLLVDVGVLEDDNWFVVTDLQLKFGGVDRENPRGEVVIYEQSNDTIRSGS